MKNIRKRKLFFFKLKILKKKKKTEIQNLKWIYEKIYLKEKLKK